MYLYIRTAQSKASFLFCWDTNQSCTSVKKMRETVHETYHSSFCRSITHHRVNEETKAANIMSAALPCSPHVRLSCSHERVSSCGPNPLIDYTVRWCKIKGKSINREQFSKRMLQLNSTHSPRDSFLPCLSHASKLGRIPISFVPSHCEWRLIHRGQSHRKLEWSILRHIKVSKIALYREQERLFWTDTRRMFSAVSWILCNNVIYRGTLGSSTLN